MRRARRKLYLYGVVRVPPGVVMVSPLGVQRNASRAQCEGRAREGYPKSAARGIIKAGARKPRLDKRRATGRIEHTLLVGGWRHLNRPKTFARSPSNPTIPQKVTNVSIYHKGAEYYVILSRILQMYFGEFPFHALR